MTDNLVNVQTQQESPTPNPDLKGVDILVGTWKISGGAEGQVSYEWMDGRFFLMQHVDLGHDGNKITGLEIIGHEQKYGAEPGADIKSRFYSNKGETFDYVYELDGATLTIWGGEKGSPAHYRGTFSADHNVLTGGWVYPGGGGYESTATRVKK